MGITKFCVHPEEWFRKKTRVGGTKNLHLNQIDDLQPDLILANKEENTKEQIEALQAKYPVYISDIHDLDDALEMIRQIGSLVHKSDEAETIICDIASKCHGTNLQRLDLKTLYLIWYDPWMSAGVDTFIHSMLDEAGLKNCVMQTRYPILTADDIIELAPEVILLSSEPYPFKQKHLEELNALIPDAKVKFVDGELFSWYGSRMSKSFEYFRALNEELH